MPVCTLAGHTFDDRYRARRFWRTMVRPSRQISTADTGPRSSGSPRNFGCPRTALEHSRSSQKTWTSPLWRRGVEITPSSVWPELVSRSFAPAALPSGAFSAGRR